MKISVLSLSFLRCSLHFVWIWFHFNFGADNTHKPEAILISLTPFIFERFLSLNFVAVLKRSSPELSGGETDVVGLHNGDQATV